MKREPNHHPSKSRGRSPHSSPSGQALNYQDTYLCPVCRHGHITQLVLMDAFACDFCRHIFEANLKQQTVHVIDSSQPMIWYWDGWRWRSKRSGDENLTLFLWLIGGILVILPVAMIGISAYMFPPLPGSRLAWLPTAWAICTFISHLFMVSWLMAEHYQPPLYVLARLRLSRWLHR